MPCSCATQHTRHDYSANLERVVVLRMQRVDLQHLLQQFLVQRRPSAGIRTQSVAHRRRPTAAQPLRHIRIARIDL